MATGVQDFKLAAAAAGFTLGFGVLTVGTAIKQTLAVKIPQRSTYIYMVWGEILANVGIGIVGWLFMEGIIPLGVPVLFALLFFWVFEIQLLMQIIINRIFVVAVNRELVIKIKWITAVVITTINIAVFCIWIPAHLNPPVSRAYVIANKYWDRTSKVLICLIDALLNLWFLYIVRQRLVRHHGLVKYASLVRFNGYLMAISISMDVLLIGLMSLKNPLVYVQFHPVAYMIKLNIELSMGALIAKLARSHVNPTRGNGASNTAAHLSNRRTSISAGHPMANHPDNFARPDGLDDDFKGIHAHTEIRILTEEDDRLQKKLNPSFQSGDMSSSEDKLPLRDNYPHTLA